MEDFRIKILENYVMSNATKKVGTFSIVGLILIAGCSGFLHQQAAAAAPAPPSPQNLPTAAPPINTAYPSQNLTTAAPPSAQNLTTAAPPITTSSAQQPSAINSFVATGKIDSQILVNATSKWIAKGDWNMLVKYGIILFFGSNMTWTSNNGISTHTHSFGNFRAQINKIQLHPDNSLSIKGVMDVGTGGRPPWTNVPTTIDILGGRAISISVDDIKTNHHFVEQPIYGVVSSIKPCSDTPGPNVPILPRCKLPALTSSVNTTGTNLSSSGPKRLSILPHFAKDPINAGEEQSITVNVSDARTNGKIIGATLIGVIVEGSGRKAFLDIAGPDKSSIAISDFDRVQKIKDAKNFVGKTDNNGQFSFSWNIKGNAKAGISTVVIKTTASTYKPKIITSTFRVE
jgi:hypothetical protein